MNPTDLLYMTAQQQLTEQATVTGVAQDDKGRTDLMLDRTILYPQGGGQAWDTGTIRSAHAAFQVQEVRFIDGIVHHYGMVTEGSFAAGDAVTLQVDAARRLLNSRLHTGGHLIDEAVRNLALAWMPTKGIHYPGQAAVEFTGEVTDAEALRQQIEHEVNRLIQAGYVTKAELVDLETLAQRAHFVLPNLPKDKPIRIVTVWGEKGVPCGGTHVANISEVGKLAVRYVKAKKGEIKVAYELAG